MNRLKGDDCGLHWRSSLRKLHPKPAMPEDILDYVSLVLLLYKADYPHLASALRTLERINLIVLLDKGRPPRSTGFPEGGVFFFDIHDGLAALRLLQLA